MSKRLSLVHHFCMLSVLKENTLILTKINKKKILKRFIWFKSHIDWWLEKNNCYGLKHKMGTKNITALVFG